LWLFGGSSGSVVSPATPEIEVFDADFSKIENKNLEAKQGEVKLFSFNGQITHKITLLNVTSDSLKLLIESNPITLILNVGETKQVDVNIDEINDLEITLVSISGGNANISIKKLEGAEIVAEQELNNEPLFDVNIEIENLFKVVKSGGNVIAKIEAYNVNRIGQVDIYIEYYITSKEDNQTKLAQGADTLAVEAVTSFIRILQVPLTLKSGTYLFNVDVSYGGEKMASGHAEFRVVRNYQLFIVAGVILALITGIFFYLRYIYKKEEKLEKIVNKMRRKKKIN